MSSIRAVITDLDNTLYNWVDFYVPSFLAMVRELNLLTGISEEELKASFKRLHEKYGTTEYSFAIFELDVLRDLDKGQTTAQILEKYHPAIKAFRKTRKHVLHLYDGVEETLASLREHGKMIVAHTDALMYHAIARLKQLGVESFFDAIFAPPDHPLPQGISREDVRYFSEPERYKSTIPIQVELDQSIRKPDPRSLLPVLNRLAIDPQEAIYVGDSLTRDVLLAQRSGVFDVLAKYGREFTVDNYNELLKITYWTDDRIKEEEALRALRIEPTFAIDRFSELIYVIQDIEGAKSYPEARRAVNE